MEILLIVILFKQNKNVSKNVFNVCIKIYELNPLWKIYEYNP